MIQKESNVGNLLVYKCKVCKWTGLSREHCYYHARTRGHDDFETTSYAKMVLEIYKQFVDEWVPDGDKDKLNGNILAKWPDYLKEELNKIVNLEEVVDVFNSDAIFIGG